MSTWRAILILVGAAALGVAGTLVTRREPGFLLGLPLIAGSLIAALAIRREKVHLMIPLPAIVYFAAAVVTGAIHDRSADTSKTEIGIHFLRWLGSGFIAASAATILVIVVAGARWLLSRQLVSGQFPTSGQRIPPGRPPRNPPVNGGRKAG